MSKLMKKLLLLQKELDYFKKNEKGFNFKYTSGNELLKVIRPKMDELGLLCIPETIGEPSIKQYETVNKKGEPVQNFCVFGTMKYTWIDTESGEEKAYQWHYFGDNNDPAQAFGSALTYNERYNWLKSFHIQTDNDDPDKIKSPASSISKTETSAKPGLTLKFAKDPKNKGKLISEVTDTNELNTHLNWSASKPNLKAYHQAIQERIEALNARFQPVKPPEGMPEETDLPLDEEMEAHFREFQDKVNAD